MGEMIISKEKKSTETKPFKILVLEDKPGDQGFLEEALSSSATHVTIALLESMDPHVCDEEEQCDVVLLNLSMIGSNDIEPIAAVLEAFPNVPVVVVTGLTTNEVARDVLRLGVEDILVKGDFTATRLERSLRHSVERFDLKNELSRTTVDLIHARQTAEDYFEQAPAFNLELDVHGKIVRINSVGAKILQCEKENAVGLNWFDMFVCENSRMSLKETFRWLLDERIGPDDVIENEIVTYQGKKRWMRWRTTVLRDIGENISGVLSVGEEITSQRAAREELRKSEERYRQVVQNAGQAIVVAQDGLIQFANKRVHELLGLREKDVIEKPLANFIHEDDREMVAGHDRQWQEGKIVPNRFTFRLNEASGKLVWVEIDAVTINWNEKPATLNFITDITERVKSETEKNELQSRLLLSQKLEAVGRLAGGVAHDFNNILSVINSAAIFLLEEAKEGTEAYQDISDIKEAADKAAALTKQLLAMSRRQVLEPRTISPAKAIEELRSMLNRLLGEDVEFVVSDDGSNGLIEVDPGQLEQVMINLAVNAREAMPRGGKLTIETTAVHVREKLSKRSPSLSPGRHMVISVQDTGMGISKDSINHIFEPFFTTKETGSGLGLATVYGIVAQSKGCITVDSREGTGTRFDIFLPRQDRTSIRAPSAYPAPVTIEGSETILVVEDDKMVRHVTCRALERSGYNILAASNAGEALLLCDSYDGPIHMVVSDVVMPFMGGPEMVPRLLDIRPAMKVLFMSGFMEREVVRQLEDQNAPFIQKPFSPRQLIEKVRGVLDSV